MTDFNSQLTGSNRWEMYFFKLEKLYSFRGKISCESSRNLLKKYIYVRKKKMEKLDVEDEAIKCWPWPLKVKICFCLWEQILVSEPFLTSRRNIHTHWNSSSSQTETLTHTRVNKVQSMTVDEWENDVTKRNTATAKRFTQENTQMSWFWCSWCEFF